MKPEGIVVHCTGGRPEATAEEIDQVHVNERGFAMIGYHFLIRRDGSGWIVEAGRPVWMEGAHCRAGGRNLTHLGVAIAGDYEQYELPDLAFELLVDVLVELCTRQGLSPDCITYHRREQELAGSSELKACPGRFVIDCWDLLINEISVRLPCLMSCLLMDNLLYFGGFYGFFAEFGSSSYCCLVTVVSSRCWSNWYVAFEVAPRG